MRAILTYHSLDQSGSVISVDPATFRRQMQWLAQSDVKVVPLSALPTATGNAVALSFDDAFLNFAEIALPLLNDHGFPATLFVVTEKAGTINDWMHPAGRGSLPLLGLLDWSGIARAAEQGVEIGAHGRRHVDLAAATRNERVDEISGAALDIERELGRRPAAFAFPYGRWDRTSAALVAEEYALSCGTDLRVLAPSSGTQLLPRLDMYYFRRGRRLESFGQRSFARYIDSRRVARTFRTSLLRLRPA